MNKKKHILLTGGTGLIGSSLTEKLLAKGYEVSHLSRFHGNNPKVNTYLWDLDKGTIDGDCIKGVDTVIHLAGAGIAEKRWTKKRKQQIMDSRTQSIGLIYKLLAGNRHQVKSVISASAIGYYSDRGDELMTETSPPANDFMAKCCIAWENAVDQGKALGLRIVKYRTGVVLDNGGALAQLAKPIRLYAGSPLGSGKQWISWIHWQDVAEMYLYAIENESLEGTYNMVAPQPVTNRELTQAVAKRLAKPLWLPNVPAFVLKVLLGEMAIVVLGSTLVSANKIEAAGFKFAYSDLAGALKEIYE